MINEKKCLKCKILKSLTDFHINRRRKDGHHDWCKKCRSYVSKMYHARPEVKERDKQWKKKRRSTEEGFLRWKYSDVLERAKKDPKYKCCFTFDEFVAAWEKHKSIYGKRSYWGSPYLEITMIYDPRVNKGGKKSRHHGNLSPDRLDSSRPYTIQNLIFIRVDENSRKKDTAYKDCLIQIKLHEERFINMEAI